MTTCIYKDEEETLIALAKYFIEIAQQSIQKNNAFNVALSGGHSPEKLYQLLTTDTFKQNIDWTKVFFFFGDERYVPENDKERNSLMAQVALFDPLKIEPSQIFKVDTTLSPDEAAKQYEKTISNHFKNLPIHFDLILLGLGDNAHTASLFPFTIVLHEKEPSVKAVFVKEINAFRITLTAPLINQAKHIAFLVYGIEKAEAIHQILEASKDIDKYPAQLIQPTNGSLLWFLDKSAASLLNQ